jgi:uncharacterized damage-inducible protein DinB
MAALQSLGARSVPVVAVGDDFVFAQSLSDVAELLGIDYDSTPELSPDELVDRLDGVLAAAMRLVAQIPAEALGDDVMNRARSYRQLSFHIFEIVEAFLERTVKQGVTLELEHLNADAPDDIQTTADITAHGAAVRARLNAWWTSESDRDCRRIVRTYWGDQPLHHVLERTAWHPAQHVRQLAMLLPEFGITPDRPLTDLDLSGLPLPEKVWDD